VSTLKPETFKESPSEQKAVDNLLKLVRQAMHNIAFGPGQDDGKTVNYHPVGGLGRLRALNPKEDLLDPSYLAIWNNSTLEYDPGQPGAEIYVPGRRMYLGPFMLDMQLVDLEKTIIHEYLHAALNQDWQRLSMEAQHPQINLIIKQRLKYAGPPNPADPSSGWNQPD